MDTAQDGPFNDFKHPAFGSMRVPQDTDMSFVELKVHKEVYMREVEGWTEDGTPGQNFCTACDEASFAMI